MSDFDAVIPLVLKEEGGKVDDPRDPGGRTDYGITQRTYDAWRHANHLRPIDVFGITTNEARAIYWNRYASPIHYDELPVGIRYCVLDCAVNEGPLQAIKDLQRACGVSADGIVGAITLDAANRFANKKALINRLCDARLTFLRRLKAFATFGRGWTNRVEFVRTQAKLQLNAGL